MGSSVLSEVLDTLDSQDGALRPLPACSQLVKASRLLPPAQRAGAQRLCALARLGPRAKSALLSLLERYCCKSLFAPLIKNSPGRGRDFRVKIRGTSPPTVKLTVDLGNVIEATKIDDRRSDCPLT